MSEQDQMLYVQHRTVQDQFTYFLLATTAAAIAFAVQKTLDEKLAWSMIPLAAAVASWGLSFYFGCKQLATLQQTLLSNSELLALRDGTHPNQPDHPLVAQKAFEIVRNRTHAAAEMGGRYSRAQFQTLILGGALFIGWHVFEMYLRTVAPVV